MSARKILIVDDELSVRQSLREWFLEDGWAVTTAENGNAALQLMDDGPYDIVLLDLKMPGMDGITVQKRIRELDKDACVIILTAFASVETAVEALKLGAFDYVTKPVDPDDLSNLVRNALRQRELTEENVRLKEKVSELAQASPIVGDSPKMQRVFEMIRTVAETDSTVVIRGESGTGKELIARSIHAQSKRRFFPIVAVNAGSIPESLLESELFGHEKGAFTGAQYRRKGKIEMADGGTLFLDEIGTISLQTQVNLLRVIETKEFTRLGGSKPIHVDFRIICATNQNLEQMVKDGEFREDLYFRVNVFSIVLPPLRERPEDIPMLAQHFLDRYAMQMNRPCKEFEPAAMDLLVRHPWPGNVRELANAVERALVVGKPPTIRAEDLPLKLGKEAAPSTGDSLADVERVQIEAILRRTGWNITRAAEVLKIDRVTLYNKIKKYELRK
jgi:DNA-binding NtrC family response regulator